MDQIQDLFLADAGFPLQNHAADIIGNIQHFITRFSVAGLLRRSRPLSVILIFVFPDWRKAASATGKACSAVPILGNRVQRSMVNDSTPSIN